MKNTVILIATLSHILENNSAQDIIIKSLEMNNSLSPIWVPRVGQRFFYAGCCLFRFP